MNILRVPIQLDALYVGSGGLEATLPMADFSALPYFLSDGSTVNTNTETPNLAEVAFHPALGRGDDGTGTGLALPQGVHLHWALPDALTMGHSGNGGTQFPAVPNRWLVRRLDSRGTPQKAWVVESDYLHPLDARDQPTIVPPPNDDAGVPATAWPNGQPVTFPVTRTVAGGKPGAAFRYMGRALPLDTWQAGGSVGTEYLNLPAFSPFPLTAMGYGEPSFAAYYPNCYSLFGFCDPDPGLDPTQAVEYQVIGWYNEADLDPLQSEDFAALATDADRYTALENEPGWVVDANGRQLAFPGRTVCYASLVLTPARAAPWTSGGSVDVAVGVTGGEALAALLASRVAGGDATLRAQVEDQLEGMNLAPALQGIQVDYRAGFDRLRHERGFVGVPGGTRWAVLPQRGQPASASGDDAAAAQPPLPDGVAQALNALNGAQEAYDLTWQEITELRYQAFFDWHKFLATFYSSASWAQPFRQNSDSFRQYVEQVSVALVNQKTALAGTLAPVGTTWQATGASDATLDTSTATLSPAAPANSTLAVQVLLRLKALLNAVQTSGLASTFQVVAQPAERFWRPREPVVLLSGDVAVNTDRHGEDGDLPCGVVTVGDAPGSAPFVAGVDSLKPAAGDPALQTQDASPWHPIILEWKVSVAPMTVGRTENAAIADTLDYDTDFLTGSFSLRENVPDLTTSVAPPVPDHRDTYEGRCEITPAASDQLGTNVGAYLAGATLFAVRDPAADGETNYVDRLIAWFQQQHPTATPPAAEADRAKWIQAQKPFVDGDGNLLFAASLPAWYARKPVAGGRTAGAQPAAQQAADPFYSAVRALAALRGMNVLSQALGGFNAAMMLREQVLQIPIEDPLAPLQAQPIQQLTTDVAAAVSTDHPFAPLDEKVFSPLRTGRLTLNGLRLVDTFGQQWNAPLAGGTLVVSDGYSDPNQPGAISLPPRFTPPVRLDFRWLGALPVADGADEVEMNSAPATTPIVGWLLPNNLESSVDVYDADGTALGSISALAEWSPAPASTGRIAPAEIPDPCLRRLVRRLVVDVGTPDDQVTIRQHFLQSFLSTLDSALEGIEPASFAQHEALSLLIGRPVAVARAQVELRMMGQPLDAQAVPDATIAGGTVLTVAKSTLWKAFVDQSFDVFAYDWGQYFGCSREQVMNDECPFLGPPPALDQYARTTHGFQNVGVPVRLGEHQLMNDGLVGFWTESGGDLDNVFHAPQTLDGLALSPDVVWKPGITTPAVRAYTEGQTDNLTLTLQDGPLDLTLLLDPRGVVHATCGVVPVRQLQIPSAYYANALQRMGVTFRVGPVLTDSERLYAAVPTEPGFAWSWVTRPDGSTWVETSDIADLTEHAEFFNPPLLVEGWLKLTPSGSGE